MPPKTRSPHVTMADIGRGLVRHNYGSVHYFLLPLGGGKADITTDEDPLRIITPFAMTAPQLSAFLAGWHAGVREVRRADGHKDRRL